MFGCDRTKVTYFSPNESERIGVIMENILTSTAIQRVLQVSRNGMPVLTTNFAKPKGDLPFWRLWLRQADLHSADQAYAVTFCAAKSRDVHQCLKPLRSEYHVSGFELPNEPDQLLDSVRLEPTAGSSITVDSLDHPQVLTMHVIVSVKLKEPEVEVSTSRRAKLNVWSGRIEFV